MWERQGRVVEVMIALEDINEKSMHIEGEAVVEVSFSSLRY